MTFRKILISTGLGFQYDGNPDPVFYLTENDFPTSPSLEEATKNVLSSVCGVCGEPFAVGEGVVEVKQDGYGWVHLECIVDDNCRGEQIFPLGDD